MLLDLLKKWFKQWRCEHEHAHVRNIHGDEIVFTGWNRSIWLCGKCDHVEYRKHLHPIPPVEEKSTQERKGESIPNLDKLKTVNSDEEESNEEIDGYDLTMAEAVEMAYKAQDIQHALACERDRILNDGHVMRGPSGRLGFQNMRGVLAYIQKVEEDVVALRSEIKALRTQGSTSVTKAIRESFERITVKD